LYLKKFFIIIFHVMMEKVLNFFMLAGDDVEKFSIVCRDEYTNGHYCSPGLAFTTSRADHRAPPY